MAYLVPYTLDALSQYWVAPGRTPIPAPPFDPPPPPPPSTAFLLDDSASILDGTQVIG